MATPSTQQENQRPPQSAYRQFLATREEILKLKWVESEQAGRDVGFEHALLDWAAAKPPATPPKK